MSTNEMQHAMAKEYVAQCQRVKENLSMVYALLAPLREVHKRAEQARMRALAMQRTVHEYDAGGRNSIVGEPPQVFDLSTLAGWTDPQLTQAAEHTASWTMGAINDPHD